MYDLVLIRRFEAVYRQASFSRGAEALGITHSAMTKSIRALEELWGVQLFERTTRSVIPTAAGRQLAELAPGLLAHAEQGRAQVLAASRRLSVVCGPAIIDSFIPAALFALRRDHPGLMVEVENLPPDLAVERLLQRRSQLLLYHPDSIAGFAARRDLDVTVIRDEPYHMLCRADHPAAGVDDPDALLEFAWAIAGFDTGFAAALDPARRDALRRAGFPQYRLTSQYACVELARSGAAITMLPRTAALQAEGQGAMISREVPGAARFTLAAVRLAGDADPIADHLLAALAKPALSAIADGGLPD